MSAGEDVSGVNILDMNPQVKDYSLPGTQLDMTMKYKTAANPESPAGGVCESSNPARGAGRNVEAILSDIVTRLERIEEKIDETIYPPESAIKPEFAIHVKKARAEIKKGNGKSYHSVDDFFKEIASKKWINHTPGTAQGSAGGCTSAGRALRLRLIRYHQPR